MNTQQQQHHTISIPNMYKLVKEQRAVKKQLEKAG